MSIICRPFGTTRAGQRVNAYTLDNPAGASVTVLDYGATIQSLCVPNGRGERIDVVLGYDTLGEYEENTCYLGATVGRVCNRIGGATFSLNGTTVSLAHNDGNNHIHGGRVGFDRQIWTAQPKENALAVSRLSPDGEEGYPGNLLVQVTFSFTQDNALHINFDGDCDRDTLVSLTSHSYFNLSGSGSVLDHELQIFAARLTETDGENIPTGRLLNVAETPFDFRLPKPIGQDINAPHPLLRAAGGYDHNFVLSGNPAAVLRCRKTGLELSLETSLPGLQLYTANFLPSVRGKGGFPMACRGAVCLEPQLFPDAIHHYGFPSPILHAGEHLHEEIVLRFRTFLPV